MLLSLIGDALGYKRCAYCNASFFLRGHATFYVTRRRLLREYCGPCYRDAMEQLRYYYAMGGTDDLAARERDDG